MGAMKQQQFAGDLQIHSLRKVYGKGAQEVVAIADLNLSIRAGEFLCILGPSGCGKSSLLNILAGFEPATAGQALVNGKSITGPSHDVGVVFQDTASLFPWLSVSDNIAFGLKGRISASVIAEKVLWALQLVGLEGFGDKFPNQLSGGMRQLAALARVLVTDSKVLLMDEPFAALDALTRQKMQKKLIEIWQATGKTIILITHSVDEAIYLGSRVIVFSPRPASIAEEMQINLPYPRKSTSPEFNQFKEVALERLGFQ
jgi:NitT/TauT family transport system ATP-binding protein